ncbi:FadR/GntR family transcriptional regulator [Thermohalobacter berrensis]|uniref:GntR family transcriptional regulator n=1 Tax=Thermohalobacter berrensis TaxID=99594 RepID=A0A419T1V1_9FIRM|nr:FadR/GntR family transcriptional regulator [Thermohalobacter berrensis]RKD31540.1 GntR family transcriptional regulator [Thermohalobacter berrensis]
MLKPIKNKKIYEYVIEQIQDMIMNGAINKGDRLPSERELAEQLKVSRTSVREALRVLEVIGLIESRQGEGNFVTGNIENKFFEPLSVFFRLNKGKPSDILELRKIIEIETASLAAQRITKKDIEKLENLLNRMRETDDEEENSRIDKEFHYTIAKATDNYLIIGLFNIIPSLMEAFIKDARLKILKRAQNREILVEQHGKIFNALKDKKPKDAAKAMLEHLEFANKMMNKK